MTPCLSHDIFKSLMAGRDKPIGIFDSGIGGLTVFKAVREALPGESIVYLGDTARVPYGTKSRETIIRYSLENSAFLMEKGVKAIVVACNTSSAHALPSLADKNGIPIIGVIRSGARAALASTRNNRIGVIGTTSTIMSGQYATELKYMRQDVWVASLACPLFVPLVEEGWVDNEIAHAVAERYLGPLNVHAIDTLILGCTHYPLLKRVIGDVVGPDVALIDSAESVAGEVRCVLAQNGLLSGTGRGPDYRIYVTDLPSRFELVAQRFLSGDLPPVERVEERVQR